MADPHSITPLADFLSALKAHDWYFRYSDSSSVYAKGSAEASRLLRIANESDEHMALYKRCSNAVWNQGGEKLSEIELPKPKDENKVSLFKRAHEMTKKVIQAGDDYRVTFAAALRALYAKTLALPENIPELVSDGKVFAVEFIKRSTGALRKMRCRVGVRSHLKGGAKRYDANAKRLLTVFDMEAKGYRSIPLEGIKRLTVHGRTYAN